MLGQDSCPLSHSLLRSHVRLRDADFVHKLAKSNSVVSGEAPQDLGWMSTGKRGPLSPSTPCTNTGGQGCSGRRGRMTSGGTLHAPNSPCPHLQMKEMGLGGQESCTEHTGEGGLL